MNRCRLKYEVRAHIVQRYNAHNHLNDLSYGGTMETSFTSRTETLWLHFSFFKSCFNIKCSLKPWERGRWERVQLPDCSWADPETPQSLKRLRDGRDQGATSSPLLRLIFTQNATNPSKGNDRRRWRTTSKNSLRRDVKLVELISTSTKWNEVLPTAAPQKTLLKLSWISQMLCTHFPVGK